MSTGELWAELADLLRQSRTTAGVSLRRVEQQTAWGRGSLSQIENGKARPTRAHVEWYDQSFGADGLLVSIYAEARGAHGPSRHRSSVHRCASLDDRFSVSESVRMNGELVRPGAHLEVGWSIMNTGSVPWRDRQLRRVGATAGHRLIATAAGVSLSACDPGGQVEVRLKATMPAVQTTVAAYWEIVDDQGNACFPEPSLIAVVLVVDRRAPATPNLVALPATDGR